MKRWRAVVAGPVALLGLFFSGPASSGATFDQSLAPENEWAAVGIDIIDDGAASYAWDPAPGAPESYTVVLETPHRRVSATVDSDARTSRVALPSASLHEAKTAWVVANYGDGSEIPSELMHRDGVENSGPPLVLDGSLDVTQID